MDDTWPSRSLFRTLPLMNRCAKVSLLKLRGQPGIGARNHAEVKAVGSWVAWWQWFSLKRVRGRVEVHHRDTEDAEGAQRVKQSQILNLKFQISVPPLRSLRLCGESPLAAHLI